MLKSISKEAYRVHQPQEAPLIFRRAIGQAIQPPPGPISVEIPIDFQASLITVPELLDSPPHSAIPGEHELAAAVDRMLNAKRPLIWAGSGAMFSDSGAAVTELMQLLDAGVITTQSGRGIVPETDSRCIGNFATFETLRDL